MTNWDTICTGKSALLSTAAEIFPIETKNLGKIQITTVKERPKWSEALLAEALKTKVPAVKAFVEQYINRQSIRRHEYAQSESAKLLTSLATRICL